MNKYERLYKDFVERKPYFCYDLSSECTRLLLRAEMMISKGVSPMQVRVLSFLTGTLNGYISLMTIGPNIHEDFLVGAIAVCKSANSVMDEIGT